MAEHRFLDKKEEKRFMRTCNSNDPEKIWNTLADQTAAWIYELITRVSQQSESKEKFIVWYKYKSKKLIIPAFLNPEKSELP